MAKPQITDNQKTLLTALYVGMNGGRHRIKHNPMKYGPTPPSRKTMRRKVRRAVAMGLPADAAMRMTTRALFFGKHPTKG